MTQNISENSRRVAKNTLLLYVRMLLMMVIGLFTSRVILRQLGVEDFGTYTIIYEMVMLFSILSNSVGSAISRFMAYELGRGGVERQRKVFGSAMSIQAGLALVLAILASTAGMWYLHNGLALPRGVESDAEMVLTMIVVMVALQLFSVPFNSAIIAHEDMKAFAWISLVEAGLKLAVAAALSCAPAGKLLFYACLMTGVTAVIRLVYLLYCHRHYEMTRGTLEADPAIMRQMLSFSAWSFLGNGTVVLSTKGVSLLANSFFGVGINAARGIAVQVENIVKQFVSNFLTALNPQITKSWADGKQVYCNQLVGKGCKFSILIMSFFVIPFAFESSTILNLWLGDVVPAYAAQFTSLTLIYLLMDMGFNPLLTMIQATGRIAVYYCISSLITLISFIATYIALRMGCSPLWIYIFPIMGVVAGDMVKLCAARRQGALPIGEFLRENVGKVAIVIAVTSLVCLPVHLCMEEGWVRMCILTAVSTLVLAALGYGTALTEGERDFVKSTIFRSKRNK